MAVARKSSPARAALAPQAAAEPISVFARAKRVVAPTGPAAAANSKALVPVPGLGIYASVTVAEKVFETIKIALRVPVALIAYDRWKQESAKTSTRPENFRGVEATFDSKGVPQLDIGKQASIESRKRATNSPLKPEQIALLEKHGVSFEWAPASKASASFVINAKYAADAALMERVGQALAAVSGLPEDFIIEAVKPVVSEQTLTDVFARRGTDTDETHTARISDCIDVVTVMGVKPVSDIEPVQALKDITALIATGSVDLTAKKEK